MNCNPRIITDNTIKFFDKVGVKCANMELNSTWWANDQPSVDAANNCLGFQKVPDAVICQGSNEKVRRVCRCSAPSPTERLFGTGYSQGYANSQERPVFAFVYGGVSVAKMTHFWVTPAESNITFRYYVDGEATASIQFEPSMACGVGFHNQTAPWGTRWFGKGAKTGGWFWDLQVPFQRSIRITVQSDKRQILYLILRGEEGEVEIGGKTLPAKSKLFQQRTTGLVQPMEFVSVVDIPAGTRGMFFMHTLSFAASNLNSLEGCYHLYTPRNTSWPGLVMSTGTEDYFDSAYYFDAGTFHMPTSGFTHLVETEGRVTFSAYRFHDHDHIFFDDGLLFQWRNGDMDDASGIKCMILTGGKWNGHPGPAIVNVYAWAYVW